MRKIMFYLVMLFGILTISIDSIQAYQEYKIGDKITYNGINYYVIMNSDSNDNYVELMKEIPLTADEINKYATSWKNSSNKETIALKRLTDQTKPYNQQEFKSVIDSWVEREFGENAIEVDGYKARLLNGADAYSLGFAASGGCSTISTFFSYEKQDHVKNMNTEEICNSNNQCYKKYTFNSTTYGQVTYRTCDYNNVDVNGDIALCDLDNNSTGRRLSDFLIAHSISQCVDTYENPTSLVTNNDYDWLSGDRFWTMVYIKVGEYNWIYYCDSNELYYSTGNASDELAIRPVVNIKKSALGNKEQYTKGEEITYNNQKYNVLYDIENTQDYVPALKRKPLTTSEIGDELSDTIQYYSSDNCNIINGNTSGCTNDYKQSFVKDAMENWANDNFKNGELKTIDGYKVRPIMHNELIENLGYETGYINTYSYLMRTDATPQFVYNQEYTPYWIIGPSENENEAGKLTERYETKSVNNKYKVRPVIFLSKCALGDKDCQVCKEGTTPIYEKKAQYIGKFNSGQTITINNERYIVLGNVTTKAKTIKLLRLNALTSDQINTYSNGEYQSTNGEIPFNLKCYNNNDYSIEHQDECYDYNSSSVKQIVDNWSKETFKDSFVNSYLLSMDELLDILKYERKETFNQYGDIIESYHPTDETPTEILETYTYFTSGTYGQDINFFIDLNTLANVRPVIEIDKCAVEGGCEYEDVITGCLTPDGKIIPVDSQEEVEVENTLSMLSKITIIISMIFIVIGLFIYLYNINKIKNEKN